MSIQNNLDIIVNSQIKPDFQAMSSLSGNKTSSSYNFEDLLRSAQNDLQSKNSETETVYKNTTAQNDENQTVNQKTEVDASSESQEIKKSETTNKKNEVKSEKSKDEKSENSEKTEIRGEKSVISEIQNQKSENDVKKSEKKDSNKLKDSDFERIDFITQKSLNEAEVSGNKKSAAEIKVKGSREKNDDLELSQLTDLSEKETVLNKNDFENLLSGQREGKSDGETDFNFDGAKQNSKISKLDKDGKITVQDERTENLAEKSKFATSTEKGTTELKITGENSATITMNMADSANSDVVLLNNQTTASSASNYQAMFNNQLISSTPDFVQAGKIILKNNNQGTINLVLHPDDLGNVKIHLSLDGKTVSAQISVATKEAMEVFKDNSETLREAFIKQGFENATFDVSYENSGNSFDQNSDFNGQYDDRERYAKRAYGDISIQEDSGFDNFPDLENFSNTGNYSVNIVA
jgi:flagellar protein FlbC